VQQVHAIIRAEGGRADAATGAGVLGTGTGNWIPALDGRGGCHPGGVCEAAMVQRMTANILKFFGQGPAARLQPPSPTGSKSPPSKLAGTAGQHRQPGPGNCQQTAVRISAAQKPAMPPKTVQPEWATATAPHDEDI
jgi:hypothetical protein